LYGTLCDVLLLLSWPGHSCKGDFKSQWGISWLNKFKIKINWHFILSEHILYYYLYLTFFLFLLSLLFAALGHKTKCCTTRMTNKNLFIFYLYTRDWMDWDFLTSTFLFNPSRLKYFLEHYFALRTIFPSTNLSLSLPSCPPFHTLSMAFLLSSPFSGPINLPVPLSGSWASVPGPVPCSRVYLRSLFVLVCHTVTRRPRRSRSVLFYINDNSIRWTDSLHLCL